MLWTYSKEMSAHLSSKKIRREAARVPVGMLLTKHPPDRTVRAAFPHTAPTLDVWRQSDGVDKDVGPWRRAASGRTEKSTSSSSVCGCCRGRRRACRHNRFTRCRKRTRSRMGVANADVVLGIEVIDFAGVRSQRPGSRRISITANDLFAKSNYTDYLKFAETDIAIQADGEATLPLLVDAVKRLITPDRKRVFEERGAKLAGAHKEAFDQYTRQAAIGWNDSPVSTARVTAELWPLIKNEDWSLVADLSFFQDWPMKLWNFDKHYQFIGGPGGYGIGYGAPAAVGAAIANKKYGRISINIQQDGDLMMGPGSLWTAANHHVPLLTIMHNNQGFHNECMEAERLALRRGRDGTRAHIGNRLIEPVIDYAKMAQSMGMYGEGPISDPSQLGPALKRAVDVVKRGEPAMVDVRTQPR